jgi:hypothetical protein
MWDFPCGVPLIFDDSRTLLMFFFGCFSGLPEDLIPLLFVDER